MILKTLKPRKKPVQARSAEMVRLILEAAARILETRGLEGYTTNAVAEAAGVSVGSLYQYFPGKDALTVALIAQETAVLLADVAEVEKMADGAAALRQLVEACARNQMRRPELARLLDLEEPRLCLHDQQDNTSAQVTKIIKAVLGKMRTPDSDDLDTVAADILAITKGMVDSAGERRETDMVNLERRVARAVFGYLSPDGGTSQMPTNLSG